MIVNIWEERGWELWSKLMLVLSNYHANFIISYWFTYQSMRIFNANPTILFLQKTGENWGRYSTIIQNGWKMSRWRDEMSRYIIYLPLLILLVIKPRLWLKPSMSRPKPSGTAQASFLGGLGRKKPSLTGGFQAEPSRHITTSRNVLGVLWETRARRLVTTANGNAQAVQV